MSTRIELVDHDFVARRRRERRLQVLAAILCLVLFVYPEWKDYRDKWAALTGARKLTVYLNSLRVQAILTQTPFEARFVAPDTLQVFQVQNCGPNAPSSKLSESKLSDFGPDLIFPGDDWVRKEVFPLQESGDALVHRYCYDPLYGSSLQADGIATASFYLVQASSLKAKQADHAVRIMLTGEDGDLSFF